MQSQKEIILNILLAIRPDLNGESISHEIPEDTFDSLDVIQIFDELEKEFSISIDGADFDPTNFLSINNLVDLVNRSQKIS